MRIESGAVVAPPSPSDSGNDKLQIPEFDGVYYLTTNGTLVEVPEVQVRAEGYVGNTLKRYFLTDSFHNAALSKFRALIVRGADLLDNMRFTVARRSKKIFSSEFDNSFSYDPGRYFPLSQFKKKRMGNDTYYFEPVDKKFAGNASEGDYLLVVDAHDKRNPRLWLLGTMW